MGDWNVLRIMFCPPNSDRFGELKNKFQEVSNFNLVLANSNIRKPFMQVIKAASFPKTKYHHFCTGLDLELNVNYIIKSIISYHYFTECAITNDFYEVLKNAPASVNIKVLKYIFTSKSAIYDPMSKFHETFKRMGLKLTSERSFSGYCIMLIKVLITPRQLYIQPQLIETTNCVIQHYKDYTDLSCMVSLWVKALVPCAGS